MVKFHYVNRKSEGPKLGQVVGKDLLKRIPPGPNYKAAIRDPVVDIDISGKALSDEGLQEVAKALITSMIYDGEHGKVVRLEELCLRESKLTARCLRPLAGVIALAASDLRDLDLSGNSICIITDHQAADWEEFLESFAKCCTLRRIDLSGNALGRRAFEILARVYGKSEPIDELLTFERSRLHPDSQASSADNKNGDGSLTPRTPKASVVSDVSGCEDDWSIIPKVAQFNHHESSEEMENMVQHARRSSTVAAPFDLYPKTRGLRSIPYLVFANTSTNDNCALHLSYIVENHHNPHHLLHYVPLAKAGLPAQQLEAYNQIEGCDGIIYRPNNALGNAGNKVLELAELARNDTSEAEEMTIQVNFQELDILGSPLAAGRQASDARPSLSPLAVTNRRKSIVSADVGEQNNHAASRAGELHRARSRIEGDVLRDFGPQSNDLWRSSLKMLSVSRVILLEPKKPREAKATGKLRRSERKPLAPQNGFGRATAFPRHPLSTPLAPGNPNQPIIPKLPHRRKNSPDVSDLKMTRGISRTEAGITEPPPTSHIPQNDNGYRSPLPGGLDERLWGRIISLACGCSGILNAAQVSAVIKWARDRSSLKREMEALGKAESAQIWRVLEGTGCLAYEIGG